MTARIKKIILYAFIYTMHTICLVCNTECPLVHIRSRYPGGGLLFKNNSKETIEFSK